MTILGIVLGWIFAILFGALTVSMLMLHDWLPALVLFLIVLLCLPPVTALVHNRFGFALHPVLRIVLIVGLLFVFVRLALGGEVTSIYKTPEIKARFMEIYDEKMQAWPVPYEDIFVDTDYGRVHVIASGPEDASPMLLLHASGVAGWSWKYNVAGLSQRYRTYTIDLIGDAGKSELASMSHILETGQDQAELYAEITDKLGVEKAYIVGASEGGFIATNYALHYPERVKKLVLLGPMGYAGATESVIRIMLAHFFPLKPVQESTFNWAFSDAAVLKEDFGEWFPLYMTGYNSTKVMPLPFSAEERQQLSVPALFVFGEQDNLVGDPVAATALVQDIAGVEVEVVNAGHLMAGEEPEAVNDLILDFFSR